MYIYICVCVRFSTLSLSLSLSLSTRHCCNGRADGRCASTNQSNDGLMSFHRWDRLVISETPPVEDGSSDPIPFSLSVISYGLKFKLVFFPKKKGGATYQGHFIFSWVSMNYPENQVVGTWNDAIPRIRKAPSNQSIFASFTTSFHAFTSDLERKNIQK